MTIKEWINQALERLLRAGISNYSQEAHWILEEIGKVPRTQIITSATDKMDEKTLMALETALCKREKNYPLQYILGHVEFMNLNFHVNQNVLIPRPETEELVKWAYKKIKTFGKVLELGVGSGCISIALKHYRPDLDIFALDLSEKALLVAEINMNEILGEKKIHLIHSDLFYDLKEKDFDAILSNPPYLSDQDMENIPPELYQEPKMALTCGGDGFDIYRKIAGKSKEYLKKEGLIGLEIGMNQESQVIEIFRNYQMVEQIKDEQGVIRDLIFQV